MPIFRVCSDLDQKGAVLWFKSEMKHLKHPKHLKHLKHFLWMPGLLFWGWWGCGHCGMEENKKSGGGDVRAEALSWDGEWDKA